MISISVPSNKKYANGYLNFFHLVPIRDQRRDGMINIKMFNSNEVKSKFEMYIIIVFSGMKLVAFLTYKLSAKFHTGKDIQ